MQHACFTMRTCAEQQWRGEGCTMGVFCASWYRWVSKTSWDGKRAIEPRYWSSVVLGTGPRGMNVNVLGATLASTADALVPKPCARISGGSVLSQALTLRAFLSSNAPSL